jgi:hypothetical protein
VDALRAVLAERLFEPRFWVGLGVLGALLGQVVRVMFAELVARSVARARGDDGSFEVEADRVGAL